MRSSTLAVIPLQAVSSNQYDNPAVALGRGTAGRLGAIALTVVRSLFLNQQRIKTTGPTKLTSLAQPMMFNDGSGKEPRHEWVLRPGGSSLDNIRCRGL
jgi:hypothetical protein